MNGSVWERWERQGIYNWRLFSISDSCFVIFPGLFNDVISPKKGKAIPVNRPWRPIGLWDVEAPTFSGQSAHRWRWGYQTYAPVVLYPQDDSWFSFCFFFFSFLGWGETESTWYVGHYLAYCTSPGLQMMNVEQSVEWELAGKTEVLGGKPAPMPLCPPQIPHDLTWARTRAAAVGNRRLTAWAMARPLLIFIRGWVDPRAIVQLEVLGELKNPMTISEIEPATFRLVA
jgi:hypothetical protein